MRTVEILTEYSLDRTSLPVILSASPMGAHLYTSLGFETKDTPVLECAGFSMPVMVSEPA
jgi:hypothetical protein